MIKKVLLVLGVLVLGFCAFVATRPATYHVERSTTIKAPPEAVFAAVSDLKTFNQWSPWDKRDPNMKKTFTPNTSGVGASYEWQGNKEVGSGRMTVTEHTPPTQAKMKLEFIEPFASVADVTFAVAPAAGETKATWAIDGNNNFIGKAFGVFMDMDKMLGADFEQGLANLEALVEKNAAATPPPSQAAAPAPTAPP
ncbi:MAG TPA: SRPBCC family protein [Polyangia bacterium]